MLSYALEGLGALEPGDVLAALGDPDPRVRAHALRLAEPFCRADERIAERMMAMADDPDPMVRYQLAFSLGALPGERAAAALAALAIRDGDDPWVRLAILSSVTACAGEVFTRLAGDAGFRTWRQGRGFLTALAGRPAWRTAATTWPGSSARSTARWPASRLWRAASSWRLMDGLPARGRGWPAARGGRVRCDPRGLLADARTTATDAKKPVAARTAAVRALRFAALAEVEAR